MRMLIAARPNLTPVGLGNNDTGFDTSLLIPSHDNFDDSSSAPDETIDLLDELSEPDHDPEPVVVSSDSDSDILAGPLLAESVKRKREDSPPAQITKLSAKKTKPLPAISVPATLAAPAPSKKPANAKDKFSVTVLAEEETAQQALGLKREKNKHQKEVTLAKLKIESEVRAARADAKREAHQ